MTCDDPNKPPPDMQARLEDLERRLKESESARLKAENEVTERDVLIQKIKERSKSALEHYGQQLKDSDKKLEEALDKEAAHKLECHMMKAKRFNIEGFNEEIGAPAGTAASCNCKNEPAKVDKFPSLFADQVGPKSILYDDGPQPKRLKTNHAVTKPPKPLKERLVPCAKCAAHGWKCDNNEPCMNCRSRNKRTKCRRVKCKFFASGTCPDKSSCGYAHEDDGYEHLLEHRRIQPDGLGGPEPTGKRKRVQEILDEDLDDYFNERSGQDDGDADGYGGMFRGL